MVAASDAAAVFPAGTIASAGAALLALLVTATSASYLLSLLQVLLGLVPVPVLVPIPKRNNAVVVTVVVCD